MYTVSQAVMDATLLLGTILYLTLSGSHLFYFIVSAAEGDLEWKEWLTFGIVISSAMLIIYLLVLLYG